MKLTTINLFAIYSKCYSKVASKSSWQPVIGLEIHAQIKANSKLFSPSGTDFGALPNTQVSYFDASLPGTLPVLNRKCVEEAVKTALALNSKINKCSTFDRKHYFYADLPTGYQITQQRNPISKGGFLKYLTREEDKKGGLKWHEKQADFIQIQLEQDSGKSLHNLETAVSLIDLNRAGVGLMEIITYPNFSSAAEVVSFVKELQLVLRTIDSCDGKMEEGGLRVDASVSVRKPNDPLGVRTEIKNLNSLRSLSKAIDFEIERQINLLESGGVISNDTLAFNVVTGETEVMRDKEKLHDYRFIPEPNLLPLILFSKQDVAVESTEKSSLFTMPDNVDDVNEDLSAHQIVDIDLIESQLPPLPHQIRNRLIAKYSLTISQAFIFVSMPSLLHCFETCISANSSINVKSAINFFTNEILSVLNDENISFEESGLESSRISEILSLLEKKQISLATSKEVLKLLIKNSDLNVSAVIKERGWNMVSDNELLRITCVKIIEDNPLATKSLQAGKKKSLNFLVGQVQKEMKGHADGQKISQILTELLK